MPAPSGALCPFLDEVESSSGDLGAHSDGGEAFTGNTSNCRAGSKVSGHGGDGGTASVTTAAAAAHAESTASSVGVAVAQGENTRPLVEENIDGESMMYHEIQSEPEGGNGGAVATEKSRWGSRSFGSRSARAPLADILDSTGGAGFQPSNSANAVPRVARLSFANRMRKRSSSKMDRLDTLKLRDLNPTAVSSTTVTPLAKGANGLGPGLVSRPRNAYAPMVSVRGEIERRSLREVAPTTASGSVDEKSDVSLVDVRGWRQVAMKKRNHDGRNPGLRRRSFVPSDDAGVDGGAPQRSSLPKLTMARNLPGDKTHADGYDVDTDDGGEVELYRMMRDKCSALRTERPSFRLATR